MENAINEIMQRYGKTENEARNAVQNCMYYGFSVVAPRSKEHPNGIIITRNIYGDKITIKE